MKALAEAALPPYVRKAGVTPQSRSKGLPTTVRPLPQVTVPFPQKEGGTVVLSLFSGVATSLLCVLQTGIKVKKYYSVEIDPVAGQVQTKSLAMSGVEYLARCSGVTFGHSHGAIPDNVQLMGVDVLAALPQIDLITARWECRGTQGHYRVWDSRTLGRYYYMIWSGSSISAGSQTTSR